MFQQANIQVIQNTVITQVYSDKQSILKIFQELTTQNEDCTVHFIVWQC